MPKKKGGFREINNPDRYLRLAQLRILTKILNKLRLPSYTWAFEEGRSVSDMAQAHVNKDMVISLDIRNFFPSVTQKMIRTMLENEEVAAGGAAISISELTTYRWYLPQGGLTSPKLSNLIVKNTFGPDLEKKADRMGLDMTIYADDITLSTQANSHFLSEDEYNKLLATPSRDRPLGGRISSLNDVDSNTAVQTVNGSEIYINQSRLVRDIRNTLKRHGFKLNTEKTKYMNRSRRQMVCGIVVNDKVNLPRKERNRLRAMVHNVCTNGVAAEAGRFDPEATETQFLDHLKGKLNWYRTLNEEKGNALYNKLMQYLASNSEDTEVA